MPNIARTLQARIRCAPEAPAITAGDTRHRFGALGERIGRLAGAMRGTLALPSGARVVLWMENRAEYYELLFACWTAGLVAVPVNAKLHAKELAYVVADCGAAAVFTSEALEPDARAALAAIDPSPFAIVAGSAAYARLLGAAAIDAVEVAADDVAWLFYTSGTTGRPKGAMLTHRNLAFMSLAYHADIERIGPGDTMLHAAPLSHGAGLYGLPHLLAGGHQVVLPGFDPDEVLAAFERHAAVSMFAAPTMVTRLLQAAGRAPRCPGLRTIVYGGGPMYVADLRAALDALGPRLYQLYGQGESPMTIAGLPIADHVGDGSPAHLARLASCGIARTCVELRVVGEDGRPVPTGEPGEVVTRSDCTMAGYWRNPAATAAAIRDGWLWTGDVGSLDERGYLTLRDRSKDMIISGGTNIYPREVEEVLLRDPAVLECSVVGRPHPDWGEEVIAFVVARPGAVVDRHALDALCLDNVARFKRPRAYRLVDALPKNAYGKVLKTALRERLRAESGDA
jgi:acyl-CoA synthetase (AMP-forming)/AMP-acid ligase II